VRGTLIHLSLLAIFFSLLPATTAFAQPVAPPRPNVTLLYTVRVATDPRVPAHVTMSLRGGNEINSIELLDVAPQRFAHLQATGRLQQTAPTTWLWAPGEISGELSYEAQLIHERTVKGFDSYHGGSWVLTRTSDIFLRKHFNSTLPLRTLTRVEFQLPPQWEVASAMTPLTATTFAARERHNVLTAPYGWLLMGDLETRTVSVADTQLVLAAPTTAHADFAALGDLLGRSLLRFHHLMGELPPRLVIVIGPDPMWRGGLSGEDSLYLNENLALISHDYTSTAVHELFHITQGFQKASERSDWIVEGLAEYYSLRILHDIHRITRHQFVKGVRKFEQEGHWNENFSTSADNHALYNSVPLIFFYLDELLQTRTSGKKSLIDVVHILDEQHRVSMLDFKQALHTVLPDEDWDRFLHRYIFQGHKPPYEKLLERYENTRDEGRPLPSGR